MASLKVTTALFLSNDGTFTDDNQVQQTDVDWISTTPTVWHRMTLTAATGGTTVDLAPMFGSTGTIDAFYIRNLDSTNRVKFVVQSSDGAINGRVPAGKSAFLPEILTANDIVLTANSAAVKVELIFVGVYAA